MSEHDPAMPACPSAQHPLCAGTWPPGAPGTSPRASCSIPYGPPSVEAFGGPVRPHREPRPAKGKAHVTARETESRQREDGACLMSGAHGPAPSSQLPAHGGHLPVNDRCGLHNSLCLVQKLVSGADGHQGPEPPAGPHDAVPRALVPQLLRPGCLVPGDELRLEDSAEAFGQAVVARRGRLISNQHIPGKGG